jgi:predicted transcriptional regulator
MSGEVTDQPATCKEMRNELSAVDPRLIEMMYKLEDNGLIQNNEYIGLGLRIPNLCRHS